MLCTPSKEEIKHPKSVLQEQTAARYLAARELLLDEKTYILADGSTKIAPRYPQSAILWQERAQQGFNNLVEPQEKRKFIGSGEDGHLWAEHHEELACADN